MTTYTTRTEAIQREIIEPLGEHADAHDIDAIADAVLGDYEAGYALRDDVDFWEIVANNAL